MASQTILLPDSSFSARNSFHFWTPSPSVAISSSLSATSGVTLQHVALSQRDSAIEINLIGGDLSTVWEMGGSATITVDDDSITLHPSDTAEPYSIWRERVDARQAFNVAVSSFVTPSSSVGRRILSLVLDDGVAGPNLAVGSERVGDMAIGSELVGGLALGSTIIATF